MYLQMLLEAEHSKKQCDRIVKYIGNDAERFAGLMKLFFYGEYRITQRAAGAMSYCVRKYPELIRPYFKPLMDNLVKKNLHAAVIRNTVSLLQDVKIPGKYHGRVMNACFDFIQSQETPIAIKAFSLTVLEHLTKDYPDILPELKLIIAEQWDRATPAFRSRAGKIINGDSPNAKATSVRGQHLDRRSL